MNQPAKALSRLVLLALVVATPVGATVIPLFDTVASVTGSASLADSLGPLDEDGYLVEHPGAGGLPIFGDAAAASLGSAAASSFAGTGSLTADTEVFGIGDETALADAFADLNGSFVAPTELLQIVVDLDHQGFVEGFGDTLTDIQVAVTDSLGNIRFELVRLLVGTQDQVITFDETFAFPLGETGTLSAFVSSTSEGSLDGGASSLTLLDFELREAAVAAVPEPGSLGLLALGLAALSSRRRSRGA